MPSFLLISSSTRWQLTLTRLLPVALVLLVQLGVVHGQTQVIPHAQRLLLASDSIRNPGQPFRVTVTITEFERGNQVESTTLASYSKVIETSGQFASLLKYIQPSRDSGKLMLKNGSDLWFFDPGTKASIRISPQQRLLGQASNGDVVTSNFARDYRAVGIADDSVVDGERRTRKSTKLNLVAATEDATYQGVELWLDADSQSPIKAKFYSDSGRLLKTAYYRRYQTQMNAERPTETVIIDGLNPQLVTVIRFSDFAAKAIPASWFQRDYLSRFQGD